MISKPIAGSWNILEIGLPNFGNTGVMQANEMSAETFVLFWTL